MSKLPEVFHIRVPAEWIDYNGHMGDFAYNIAFSRGKHACPGAPLARIEARVSIERLLARTMSP